MISPCSLGHRGWRPISYEYLKLRQGRGGRKGMWGSGKWTTSSFRPVTQEDEYGK